MRLLKTFIIALISFGPFSNQALSKEEGTPPPLLDYWQEMVDTELDEAGTTAMILGEGFIETPGYTNAFNPGIIKWDDGYLITFRDDSINYNTKYYFRRDGREYYHYELRMSFVIAKLDSNLKWIPGSDFRVYAFSDFPQDARLYTHNNQLYVIYSDIDHERNIRDDIYHYLIPRRCTYTAKVDVESKCLFDIEKKDFTNEWIEKNWTPFLGKIGYKQKLLYQYSIDPLKVYNDQGDLVYDDTYSSKAKSKYCKRWSDKWGPIRGGTPPVNLDKDTYLGFFHSTIATSWDVWAEGYHGIYFMGAYTYSKEYPFKIKKISKLPLFKSSFYDASLVDTVFPSRAVAFPCGLCQTEYQGKEAFIVSYGSNDSACKYVIYDTKALLESLESVD